jgi:hypothetical protein
MVHLFDSFINLLLEFS